MIMADLKTNYVDDVLDTTKNQLRKYQQIQNDDGTVSFVDVTEYTQVGTSFGAKDINDTNAAINDVNGKLDKYKLGEKIYGTSATTIPSTSWASQWLPLPEPDGYAFYTAIAASNNDVVCGVSVANYDTPNKRLLVNAYNRHSQTRDFSHVYVIPIFIQSAQ